MSKIFDPIRNRYVEATPEEIVRQQWILAMIGPLGFPKGLISVEKDVLQMGQVNGSLDLNRRVDILCSFPCKEGLKPLLLIEFKAQDQEEIPEAQVLGYNFFIKAPFLSVIQGEKVKTFWKEGQKVNFVSFLPAFNQLVAKACRF